MTSRSVSPVERHGGDGVAELRAALHDAEQRLAHHVAHSPLATIEWDAELRVCCWSPGAERIFGWSAEEAIGRQLGDDFPLFHHDDAARCGRALLRLLNGRDGRNVDVGRSLTKDDRPIHCEWYNAALRDAAGAVVAVQSQVLDITELVRARDQRVAQEAREAEVGLPGRASLAERFSRLLAGEQQAATLFLALEGFKGIVDRFGREVGDELLTVIARRLRHTLRAGDTIGKIGGDEFGILLEEVRDEGEATALARRIVAAVERPIALAGARMVVKASIGVAIASSARRDPEDLLLAADLAMQTALEAGGGILSAPPPDAAEQPQADSA